MGKKKLICLSLVILSGLCSNLLAEDFNDITSNGVQTSGVKSTSGITTYTRTLYNKTNNEFNNTFPRPLPVMFNSTGSNGFACLTTDTDGNGICNKNIGSPVKFFVDAQSKVSITYNFGNNNEMDGSFITNIPYAFDPDDPISYNIFINFNNGPLLKDEVAPNDICSGNTGCYYRIISNCPTNGDITISGTATCN